MTALVYIVFWSMAKIVETVVVGPFAVNCYVLFDDLSKDSVIIDPGAEPDRILRIIRENEINPRAILLTHGHGDHIAAVADIKKAFDLPVVISGADQALLSNPSANVSALFHTPIIAPDADRLISDEELVTYGTITLRVIGTPGHTAGGVCFLDETEGNLFCGDTLFAGSIGRTDFPGGSLEQLLDGIKSKLLKLPDSVVCYPGHGPATTIGAERTSNPFLIGGSFV